MNKLYLKWWLFGLLFVLIRPVFSQKYSIHLASFTEQVAPSFFDFVGLPSVKHQSTSFNFHQYSKGEFESLLEAEKQMALYKSDPLLKDFRHLSIQPIDPEFIVPTDDSNLENESTMVDFQLFSRSIYVQPISKSLQKVEVSKLERITAILKQYPSLKLRIVALENPSNAPNSRISTEVVKNFLLAQHIPAYRIKAIPTFPDSRGMVKKIVNKQQQQVIITLVDFKEEIVLDKFGNNGLIVKQSSIHHTQRVMD